MRLSSLQRVLFAGLSLQRRKKTIKVALQMLLF